MKDDIKIELTGTCEQFGLFRKAPIYSKLIDSGVKVSFIADPSAALPVTFSRKEDNQQFFPLLERLVKIKKDNNISNAFAELENEKN